MMQETPPYPELYISGNTFTCPSPSWCSSDLCSLCLSRDTCISLTPTPSVSPVRESKTPSVTLTPSPVPSSSGSVSSTSSSTYTTTVSVSISNTSSVIPSVVEFPVSMEFTNPVGPEEDQESYGIPSTTRTVPANRIETYTPAHSVATGNANFLPEEEMSLVILDNNNVVVAVIYVPRQVVQYITELRLSVSYANSIAEIFLLDQFGNEITSLDRPMEICLAPGDHENEKDVCLGYYNEKTKEWMCEDVSVRKETNFGLFCGTTGTKSLSLSM